MIPDRNERINWQPPNLNGDVFAESMAKLTRADLRRVVRRMRRENVLRTNHCCYTCLHYLWFRSGLPAWHPPSRNMYTNHLVSVGALPEDCECAIKPNVKNLKNWPFTHTTCKDWLSDNQHQGAGDAQG